MAQAVALPAGVELGEVADQIRRRFRVASYAAGALFSTTSCVLVLGLVLPLVPLLPLRRRVRCG